MDSILDLGVNSVMYRGVVFCGGGGYCVSLSKNQFIDIDGVDFYVCGRLCFYGSGVVKSCVLRGGVFYRGVSYSAFNKLEFDEGGDVVGVF